jgi:predicted methyltransferase
MNTIFEYHYRLLAVVALMALIVTGCSSTPAEVDPVQAAIAREGRTDADVGRDARSRPDLVLPELNLSRGDKVLDFFGGGGYYSELLASLVGEEGSVYLHNNGAYMVFVKAAFQQRFPDGPPPPIIDFQREVEELKLEANSLDAAMIIMSYHDFYMVDQDTGWREIDSRHVLGQIFAGLKPGGRFVIVDHAAAAGTGSSAAQDLHRIDESFAREDIVSNGFRFVASVGGLENPADDRSVNVFDPSIRGKTHRFILVFEKP